MINKKEIVVIVLVTLILGFVISLVKSLEIFVYTLFAVFLIILINTLAKKVVSFYLDSEVEISLWDIKRYGFKKHKQFKNPFPAGLVLPIITTVFSFGYLNWMASIVFDVKAKAYRAAKRHGLYNFSEMTEYHIGFIAAAGILANLLFAIIGYLINFTEFARLSILYSFYNIIPLSDLDGNKIFFGSFVLWCFLAAITLIGMFYAIFMI